MKIPKNKQHIAFIALLIIIMFIAFHDYLNGKRFWIGELDSGSWDQLYFSKQTITEYHEFPLWFPTYQAGLPFFAHPNYMIFFYTTIINLILPTTLALNLSLLLNMFLGGLFTYLLMINFKYKPYIAFISALIYTFSIAQIHVFTSYLFRSGVVALAPLVLLCFWKAFHNRRWIKWSIISGLVFALQFHSGGLDWFMFMILAAMSVFLTYVIGRNFKKRIIKSILAGVIIGAILFGLAAVKLFPMLEYEKVSSKQQDFTFEDTVGNKLEINSLKAFVDYFLIVPDRRGFQRYSTEIGFAGVILVLMSLPLWRKRHVMMLWLLAILAILVGTGSPVFYVMWKFIPGFSKLHHVERVGYIFVLAAAPLAGAGLSWLLDKLKHLKKIMRAGIYLGIFGLVLIDSFVFTFGLVDMTNDDNYNLEEMISKNYMMQNISSLDKGIFRINNIKTDRHSGHAGPYAVVLDQEILYGGTSLWFPELYVFLGIAHAYPAKFYGMLNTKYLYSDEPINQSYLFPIAKFEECATCVEHEPVDHGVDGPYLYLNQLYLPRAYVVNNSILVIGDKLNVDQVTYSIMMNSNFDPSNSAIIMDYGDITGVNLSSYSAVILLANSVDAGNIDKLQQYDGIILPNIMEGKTTITQEEIEALLRSYSGGYSDIFEVNITYYSPNKRIMNLQGETGWLILAEKFHMFKGWEPKINKDKKPIYRANGMNSAVYLEGKSGDLIFKYSPKSFRKGFIISAITLLIVLSVTIINKFLRYDKNEKM